MIRVSEDMRVVVVAGDGTIGVERAAVPEPGPGELLVAMGAAGICGSDVHAVQGRHPFVPPPFRPGHEVTGTVRRGGPGTSTPAGQRVVVNPVLYCGHCQRCRQGLVNLCREMAVFGCGTPAGGMADYFVVPERNVVAIPDDLTDLQAALVEPLSTPVHAVRLAGPDLTGLTVVILGAGTIGLMTMMVARQHGAAKIVMTNRSAAKRERALELGADAAFDPRDPDVLGAIQAELGQEQADVVFDCVAVQDTLDQALALVLKGGTVVVVGVPPGPVTLPLQHLQDRQIRLQGSAVYLPADYSEAIGLLTGGVVRPADFVTAQYPLAEAAAAFGAAASGQQVKVVLTEP
jgi:2-desacetyl-2-hydroxyethyl bacteriochlorophyllide A dehydrogenase